MYFQRFAWRRLNRTRWSVNSITYGGTKALRVFIEDWRRILWKSYQPSVLVTSSTKRLGNVWVSKWLKNRKLILFDRSTKFSWGWVTKTKEKSYAHTKPASNRVFFFEFFCLIMGHCLSLASFFFLFECSRDESGSFFFIRAFTKYIDELTIHKRHTFFFCHGGCFWRLSRFLHSLVCLFFCSFFCDKL